MEFLKQPQAMKFEGNIPANWKRFRSIFEIYAEATGCYAKGDSVAVATFLHIVGEEAREIFETFEFEEDDERKDIKKVIAKFEEYFVPKVNPSVERNKFYNRVQEKEEPFDTFVTDLKRIAADCAFGEFKQEMLRDRIVCGVTDARVKDRLLREKNLTLGKAIEIGRAAEVTEQHMKKMSETPQKMVEEVKVNRKTPSATKQEWGNLGNSRKGQIQWGHQRVSYQGKKEHQNGNRTTVDCYRCGRQHQPRREECPASGKQCKKCNKTGLFARMCKSKMGDTANSVHRSVHVVDNSKTASSYSYVIDSLQEQYQKPRDWYQKLGIKEFDCEINFKLDTGAQVNVIPKYLFDRNNINCPLSKVNVSINNYDGFPLQVFGSCNLTIVHQGQSYTLEFVVVETKSSAILGLSALIELNLVKRIQTHSTVNNVEVNKSVLLSEYSDVFEGLGQIKKNPCDFTLKSNYEPKIVPCRKVPFRLMDKLENTLKRMIKDEVIVEVREPTEYVHPIVLVNKPDNEVRICLDPQNLNNALAREHYEIPTFEEVTSDMSGSKIFSTLDANKGFWQITLTEQASKLTTFATPFGRFKFLRLPYGISNAPEIFHRTFTEIFQGIPNIKIYIDDIILYAKDEREHDKILKLVLERAREFGVKFNKSKSKFNQKEIKYVGHILSRDGIRVDPSKIEAIKQIKPPKNCKELSRFLGMITYVAKFIPNLTQKTSNLRQLLRKDTHFDWNETHEQDFNSLKDILTSTPVLQFYDNKKEIVLSVDSSKDGLGAVILQDGSPIAYASKSLNETQQNYAQIEKETLAIAFGCQRFHQYLYGKSFVVESDHRPLETIFKKPLNKCPLRIQRLRITLQMYDLVVKYKSGAKLYFADTLSRTHYDDKNFEVIENNVELQVNFIKYAEISPEKFETLRNETAKDFELQILKEFIIDGWPTGKGNLPDVIKPYYKFRHELTVMTDLIFKNDQIVIPKSMRKEIIEKLHYVHLGIEKTCNKARELVYWPLMITQITDKIKNCSACLKYSKSNQRETLWEKSVPTRPWQNVSADMFYFDNEDYLLVVDEFTKYPEVICMQRNTTSKRVINEVKSIFARHGKPDILFSDNGSQFINNHFQKFLKDWEILHKTSSPKYPQSNGLVERHIQTIKKLFLKNLHDGKDLYLTLLEYRNTPISKHLPSPAELLFGRKIKGLVPIKQSLLIPKHSIKQHHQNLCSQKQTQKYYYNKSKKAMSELKCGDKVVVQDPVTKRWEPGEIIKQDSYRPRAYHVKFRSNGNVLVRNRKYLKRVDRNTFQTNVQAGDQNRLFDQLLEDNLVWEDTQSVPAHVPETETVSNSPQATIAQPKVNQRPQRNRRAPLRFRDYYV
ncbi:uncharacterized protein K02A2.6-like [Zophobas morio]|uniref:uncharacterized protein K02A2.6-like n=1 Tax=Zophobas morio TaxID=2755281 RepID=UPI0030835C45